MAASHELEATDAVVVLTDELIVLPVKAAEVLCKRRLKLDNGTVKVKVCMLRTIGSA
jgi:hypothetical protein